MYCNVVVLPRLQVSVINRNVNSDDICCRCQCESWRHKFLKLTLWSWLAACHHTADVAHKFLCSCFFFFFLLPLEVGQRFALVGSISWGPARWQVSLSHRHVLISQVTANVTQCGSETAYYIIWHVRQFRFITADALAVNLHAQLFQMNQEFITIFFFIHSWFKLQYHV